MGIIDDAKAAWQKAKDEEAAAFEAYQKETVVDHGNWLQETLGSHRVYECLDPPRSENSPLTMWEIDDELRVTVRSESNRKTGCFGNVRSRDDRLGNGYSADSNYNFVSLDELGAVLTRIELNKARKEAARTSRTAS